MSSPEETRQAADLIERLLTDPAFRGEFRRDPASACERFGLTELAEELRGGSGAKALYTLELRQSMSSLAGVIMAAAAEGIGALELAGFGQADDKRVAGVVNEALSRHSIKAISRAQMPAVDHDGHGGGNAHEAHGHVEDGHEHAQAEEHAHAKEHAHADGHNHAKHDHAEHDHEGHDHAEDEHAHPKEHEHGGGHAPEEAHHAAAGTAPAAEHHGPALAEPHAHKATVGSTPAVEPPAEPHH